MAVAMRFPDHPFIVVGGKCEIIKSFVYIVGVMAAEMLREIAPNSFC